VQRWCVALPSLDAATHSGPLRCGGRRADLIVVMLAHRLSALCLGFRLMQFNLAVSILPLA